MYGQEVTISIYRNTPSTKTLLSNSVIVIIKQKSFRYMSIAFISFRIGIVQNGSKKHGTTRVTITIVHISNNCAKVLSCGLLPPAWLSPYFRGGSVGHSMFCWLLSYWNMKICPAEKVRKQKKTGANNLIR